MGIFTGIISVLGMKPVQMGLNALMGKILGKKNAVNPKVVATGGVAAWVAIGISLGCGFIPDLCGMLQENQASLVAVVGLIAAIIAYFTPNQTESP